MSEMSGPPAGARVGRALLGGLRILADARALAILAGALAVVGLVTAPLVLAFVGLAWLVETFTPTRLPGVGEVGALAALSAGLTARASWGVWTYLVSPLALAAVGLFLEPVAAAVERRDYPGATALRRRGVGESLLGGLRLLGLTVAVSAAALALAALAGAWLAPVVFIAANGWLIAREYAETVALRHLPPAQARGWFRAQAGALWLAGAALAAALTVPVVNLAVPLVGIAAFTHLFHGSRRPVATSG